MSWQGKARTAGAPDAVPSPRPGPTPAVPADRNIRPSNGLREFLWVLSDVNHGRLLDLGPVWQATVNFFTDRGFRVSTEDVLRAWKEFLETTEESLRNASVGDMLENLNPGALADKFLETSLHYPPESFNAVLAWDVLDYLDSELLSRIVTRLYEILRPGGAILALFHSRPAERFHRYRIVDNAFELLPAPPPSAHERIFQNREILNLFGQFRSSKTFVGRDQLREGLFIK
jgi:hypothetical protein